MSRKRYELEIKLQLNAKGKSDMACRMAVSVTLSGVEGHFSCLKLF